MYGRSVSPLVRMGHFTIVVGLVAGSAVACRAQSGTVADLEPELREALLRKAACADKQGAPIADQDRTQFLQVAVKAQPIHNSRGAEIGTIVTPTNTCYCDKTNCRTYVFLKSGDKFELALEDTFVFLRPMKVLKAGLPSLTGKIQVTPTEAESIIYDWNGTQYRPSLCATVTQGKGHARPTIVRHECGNLPRPESRP